MCVTTGTLIPAKHEQLTALTSLLSTKMGMPKLYVFDCKY
uniref:Uncharacterized protein n=1 Tax=Anguilla anguilla TaxID=7936 RepID=A0A0E9VTF6_ANGAN